jgi:transposase InsO family protein
MEKANYPVAWMCRMLDVPRSSFYEWRHQVDHETATAARRRVLAEQVQRVFAQQRQTAGCRRIAAQLNEEGHPCSVGLVADLMRELGLRAVQPRAYKRTTIPGQEQPATPDLIDRDFAPGAQGGEPGTRLVGDITYLRTEQGWLYLATVIDLASRMVVGWQMADHMRTSLVIDALEMARIHGHVQRGALFHSDRGTQYTSAEFNRYCTRVKVRPSMGRTGVCWDNAAAESFFATLKNEMYHRYRFANRARARFAVAEYIEVFYNRTRLHSSLGYKTPAAALTDYQTRAATEAA